MTDSDCPACGEYWLEIRAMRMSQTRCNNKGCPMFPAQQISPNLVNELRAEAGMSHGDGAEESLEWKAAAEIEQLRELLAAAVSLRDFLGGYDTTGESASRLRDIIYDRLDAALSQRST